MATRLYGVLLDGLNKPIVNATVALISKGNTLTVLNGSEAIFRTDAQGAYNVTVQTGHYKVIIGPQGIEPYKAGEIVIYSDSKEGSLNNYLTNWIPEELTPEVIAQVKELVANSEAYALQAGRSAASAQADATDARNSKAASATSAAEALTYKNDSKANADAAKQAQAGAAGSANTANAAVTTINQIKIDTQKIKDDAVAETTALKNTAVTAASTATDKATQAGQSAATSTSKADIATQKASDAEAAATRAEQAASGTLKKDQNLADVANINTAKTNLSIQGVQCITSTDPGRFNFISSPDGKLNLFVANNGNWGVQSASTGEASPLAVGRGGTGATTASEARINLELDRFSQLAGDQTRIFTGNKTTYFEVRNVEQWGVYSRSANSWIPLGIAQGGTGAMTAVAARNNLGLGVNDKVQFNQVKAYGTNGVFADATDLVSGCTFYSRYYDANNVHKGQGEFRANINGVVELINRAVDGSASHFFTFDRAGRFWSPEGITTATGLNWNNGNNIVNRALLMSGQAGAPTDLMHGGIHIGYSNSYAVQFAARDNNFYGHCLENNTWKEWKKFALENNDIVNYASGGTADDLTTTKAISFLNGKNATNATPFDGYGVIAGFGNGDSTSSGAYVGHLCWDKSSGSLYTRARNDIGKAWLAWSKITTTAVSDENVKDIKGNLNVEGALDNINRMEFKLFRYLNDSPERSTRRGVVAQQVRWIDREYTTKVGDQLHLDIHPMLMDGLAAIQALTKRDNENKEKIEQLQKDIEELKAIVSKLVNKPEILPIDSDMP